MGRRVFRNSEAVANPAQSVIAFSVVLVMVGFYFAGINSSFVSYENENVDLSAKATDVVERLLSDPGEAVGVGINWEFDPDNVTAIGLCSAPTYSFSFNDSAYGIYSVQGTSYGSSYNIGTGESNVLPTPFIPKPDYWVFDRETNTWKPVWITEEGTDTIGNNTYNVTIVQSTPPSHNTILIGGNSCQIIDEDKSITIVSYLNLKVYETKEKSNFRYSIIDERKISNLTNIDYETAKEALGIDDNYDFSITIVGANGTVLAYDSTNRYFENGDVSSTSSSNTVTVLDQSNPNGVGDEIQGYGTYIAQTFTCGQSGNLKSVELHVRNVKADGDITVKIETVQNGKPSGNVLATTTISEFSDTSFVWKNATFSSPPSLTEGTQYAIVVESISTRYAFEKNSDEYSSGEMGTSSDGITWTMDSSSDLLFKTWMDVEQNNGGGNSVQLPSPPYPPIPPGSAVSTCTRNVLIRHPVLDGDHFIYIYEPAQMTVRIY